MMQEIEAKFANISADWLQTQALKAGFQLVQAKTLLKREIFHLPNDTLRRYARVRNEGNGTITCTIKIIDNHHHIDGVREAELLVPSFTAGQHFLKMAGWQPTAYQETTREIWQRGDVQLCHDEWPGAPPFVEIEAPEPEAVQQAARDLGLDWAQAIFGTVDQIFAHAWGEQVPWINHVPRIVFNNPPQLNWKKDYAA